jgi:hypothetical protein
LGQKPSVAPCKAGVTPLASCNFKSPLWAAGAEVLARRLLFLTGNLPRPRGVTNRKNTA